MGNKDLPQGNYFPSISPQLLELQKTLWNTPNEENKMVKDTKEDIKLGTRANGFAKADVGKPILKQIDDNLINEIQQVKEFGAQKYGELNWQKAEDPSVYVHAIRRHLRSINKSEIFDSDSGLHHLAHVDTNIDFLLWFINKYTSPKVEHQGAYGAVGAYININHVVDIDGATD